MVNKLMHLKGKAGDALSRLETNKLAAWYTVDGSGCQVARK